MGLVRTLVLPSTVTVSPSEQVTVTGTRLAEIMVEAGAVVMRVMVEAGAVVVRV